jgi:hypothetical protein
MDRLPGVQQLIERTKLDGKKQCVADRALRGDMHLWPFGVRQVQTFRRLRLLARNKTVRE